MRSDQPDQAGGLEAAVNVGGMEDSSGLIITGPPDYLSPSSFPSFSRVAQSLDPKLGFVSSAPQDGRRKSFFMSTEGEVECESSSVLGHPSRE